MLHLRLPRVDQKLFARSPERSTELLTPVRTAPETSMENSAWQPSYTAFLMLAPILLVGIGYLAILPPFEGFDESVHYSSIRQVADTQTLPIFGRSFIDQTVFDYASHGPMPWSSGAPPFVGLGRMTYLV